MFLTATTPTGILRVRPRSGGALPLALVLAFTVACGNSDDSFDGPATGSVCRADGDCPGTQICRAGFCTIPNRETRSLDVRFFPPNSTSFFPQSVENIEVGPSRPLDVALEPSVVESGEINAGPGCVPGGDLVFRRKTGETGDLGTFRSVRTRLESGARSYEVALLEGRYDVRFDADPPRRSPCEAPYPPVVWKNRRLVGAGADLENLPGRDDLVRIQGRLLFSVAGVPEETARAARIFAVGTEDSSLQTTVDVADTSDPEERGRFELWALPSERPVAYDLVVESSPRAEELIADTRISSGDLEPSAPGLDGLRVEGRGEVIRLNPVTVGPYPGSRRTITLSFEPPDSVNADTVDWSRVRIVAEGAFPGGTFTRRGHLERTSESRDGSVQLDLLPLDSYRGWVLPPLDSPLRPRSFVFDASNSELETRALEAKTRLSGRVVDAAGTAVGGAKIEWSPTPDGSAVGFAQRLSGRRTASSRTGEDGTFDIWIESTTHQFVARAPFDSGLPTAVRELSDQRLSTGQIELRLPEPRLVRGHVFGRLFTAEGTISEPLPDSRVEVGVDGAAPPTEIATARSRAGGTFALIIPAVSE